MESLLQGIDEAVVYLDSILTTDKPKEHLSKLGAGVHAASTRLHPQSQRYSVIETQVWLSAPTTSRPCKETVFDQVWLEAPESLTPNAQGCFTVEGVAMQSSPPETIIATACSVPDSMGDQPNQSAPQPSGQVQLYLVFYAL